MRKIASMDLAIWARFQVWSSRVQMWTGYDCLHQANWCRVVWIGIIVHMTARAAGKHLPWRFSGMFGLLIPVLLVTVLYSNEADERIRTDALKGTLNFRVALYHPTRLIVIACILAKSPLDLPILHSGDPSGLLWSLCWFLETYLECCTPLPPQSGKIREWIRNQTTFRKLVPARVAE